MATTYLTDAEQERLLRLCGELKKPVAKRMLDDDDLDDHALNSRVKDVNGEAPLNADGTANTDYTLTIDLYRAASLGWHQKAGVFAEQFEFEADGGVFKRNQAYDMAIAQAKRYADMANGHSTPIQPETRS